MQYEKQTFVNGQVLTAECLNRMETGIKGACDAVPPACDTTDCSKVLSHGENGCEWVDMKQVQENIGVYPIQVIEVDSDGNAMMNSLPIEASGLPTDRVCILRKDGCDFALLNNTGMIAYFAGFKEDGTYVIHALDDDGCVTTTELDLSGGGSSTMIVTIDENNVASHTAEDIYDHVMSGGTAVLDRDGFTYVLVGCTTDYASFDHNYDDNLRSNYLIYDDGSVEEREYQNVNHGDLDGLIQSPSTAKVGQTIVVKSVDSNGKPTAWEAADLPSGGSSNIVVARFEDYNDTSFVCTSHTSAELRTALQNGPVMAHMFSYEGHYYSTVLCWTVDSDVFVGEFMNDSGWAHFERQEGYFVDGDISNETIGNELWIEF